MRIGVLGPLEVRDADGQQVTVGGLRLRSFLIRLVISEGSPVSADRLAADLWAEQQPADAVNAVQALASRLRGTAGRDLIEFGPAGYRVSVSPEQVDAAAFGQLVGAGRRQLAAGQPAAGAATLRQALQLWRGPALADVADAPFAAATITRLTELRLAATEDRIDADLALGSGQQLVPEVEQLATEHPLRERLRGQLMRALYAAGRQAAALAVFEDTRAELADTLGIDPSPALAAIHLAILRGELESGGPGASGPADGDLAGRPGTAGTAGRRGQRPDAAAPPAPALTAPATGRDGADASRPARGTHLPAQLTSFIGREEELARTGKLLDESRLVTLTGPGGAGKTRLAVEVAGKLAPPDGAWFVPLAPVRDGQDVPQAVLAAVGGHQTAWPPEPLDLALDPMDRLCELLTGRDVILVLDNCEHLIDAVATLAARLLAVAPAVRILATSREPLGLTGETLAPVPSLPLPAPGADAGALAGNAAARLFADRASAVRPGFVLTEDSAADVIRICRALDGIPLAIELAAARLRTLTPEQVADRLDDRFALLSVGSRGTLPRHQTLRAVVDWSWDLLDDLERMILRRLSVFSAGATPDSAEQVCWLPDRGQRPGQDVVEVIASLLDKSLVVAGGDRQVRYRLLETVRAYAAERLAEAGEEAAVAAAHAQYFLELAERAEPYLRGPDQLRWLNVLTEEHDNFTAALRYVIGAGDWASATRYVSALCWYWITHDYDAEMSEFAVATVRVAPPDVPPELAEPYAVCKLVSLMSGLAAEDVKLPDLTAEIRSLPGLGPDSTHPMLALIGPMLAMLTGNAESLQAELAGVAAHPDPWVRAARKLVSGQLAINFGDIDTAAADLTAGYAEFDRLGDRFGLMVCLTGLSEVALARGEPAEAVRILEQARALAEQGLAGHWIETSRVQLGRAMAAAGDVAGGREHIAAATLAAEKLGELEDAAQGHVALSELDRQAGDLAGARQHLDCVAAIVEKRERRPDGAFVAMVCFTKLGCLSEQEGDLTAAASWHSRALRLAGDSSALFMMSNQILAVVVEGIAALSAARGEHARAAELLGLAHTLQGYRNNASLEVRRAVAASPLTPAEFDTAYAAGRAQDAAGALALTP
jgi:predicted ATPase/DNA-binding SARP family transcriptional activator